MRAASVVALLLLANVGVVVLRQSASTERAALVDAASTLSRQAAQARASHERKRALDALIEKAKASSVDPRDIGALREVLVKAERGLSIDRLSLEFRPEERLPAAFGGSQVHASLRGRFEALYQYLGRLERMFLPLSPGILALRGDPSSVTLTIQWTARWPLAGDESNLELPRTEVSQLTQWLSREPRPRPDRDIFSFGIAEPPGEAASSTNVPEPASPEMLVEDPEPAERKRPVLTGFVLARPELEPDVRRRVLAAIRYQGELRLVKVGDTMGEYRVERMEARESVTLTRADTGEVIRLAFD